ncbi:MAG: hypothetical protein L3J83_09685, partial [Proteobacteria bacterium]|nr:hypothetical protein [Pseudomonadota bacterium]
MKCFVVVLLILFFSAGSQAQDFDAAITVRADQPELLVSMIADAMDQKGSNHIKIIPGLNGENEMLITDDYMDTSTAFPPVSLPLKITADESANIKIVFNSGANKTNSATNNFNAFYVLAEAILYLEYIALEEFECDCNGGAISAADNALIYLIGVTLYNNFALSEGGAIFLIGAARLIAIKSRLENNRSNGPGGAVSIRETANAIILLSIITNNLSNTFGCDFNVASNPGFGLTALFLLNNNFIAACNSVLIENPVGRIFLFMNIFYGNGDLVNSTAIFWMFANIIRMTANSQNKTNNTVSKAVCNDFGTGAIQSLGYNISTENSCSLNQLTDMPNTDPMLNTPGVDGLITLQNGSPAIDSGAATMQMDPDGVAFLPCSYKDSRGLGRPQDANGDGIFECDIGSYEMRNGDDLSNAQSGLFYDTGRSGEGILVEMLSNGRGLVTFFTYDSNKTDLMWFVGVGNVVGNTIVIDKLQRTTGGMFGPAFDPDAIVNQKVGSMSLIFPDCEATGNPGKLIFEADRAAGIELEHLLLDSNRLTRILNCDQTQVTEMAGRSGSFYDQSRSGEGLFVQL